LVAFGDHLTVSGQVVAAAPYTVSVFNHQHSRANRDVVRTYTVPGHNAGLRVNPETKKPWAMQNEDGDPNIVIINPKTGT